MLTCPSCHQQAMSIGQKLSLAPVKSIACRVCGTQLTVSISRLLYAVAPFAVAVFVSELVRNPQHAMTIWLIGAVVSALLQERTPLIVWTAEHEAAVKVRPSVIVIVVIGGILGIGVGMAISYAWSLQSSALMIIVPSLIVGPIVLGLLPNRMMLSVGIFVMLFAIGGGVVLGKYREERFVKKTMEDVRQTLMDHRRPATW